MYLFYIGTRSGSPVKTFREPMGNSLVLLQAIRDLFPAWDVSAEQALRAWILSMLIFDSGTFGRFVSGRVATTQWCVSGDCDGLYTDRPTLHASLTLSSRLLTLQSHNTACSPPQRRQRRCLAFLGTPRPLFLLRRGQVLPSRQPSSLLRSLAPRPVFAASQPALQPCPAAPRPTFAASQPGLAAVRRSLVSQRSLVYAPLPTAELSPLSPAWAPQFLPGPAWILYSLKVTM